MNRQSRLVGVDSWVDRGNVSLYEAARMQAVDEAEFQDQATTKIWEIEVRCQDSADIPVSLVRVKTSIVAEVLDPREGCDD